MLLKNIYRDFFKYLLDFSIAICAFFITLPILIFAAIILVFSNKGKVFFVQKRIGKDERIFSIFKLKTMNDKKDNEGNLLPDEQRITTFGKIVRKISLDEIPQLINIIKGDMSFVGPRPLLPEYLPLYNNFQKKRHSVMPGITGWAQINGRNNTTWEKRFENDVWYVENVSFSLDIKILFRTIRNVIKSEGVSSDSHATMEKFTGNN